MKKIFSLSTIAKSTKNLISVLILSLVATSANAQISYDYIEVGYEKLTIDGFASADGNIIVNFDDFDLDGDGFVFEGSFSFGKNYFAYADFDFTSFDLGSDLVDAINNLSGQNLNIAPTVDYNTQVLGLGYHTNGNTQFVAKTAFLRQEIDSDFIKEGAIGYAVELGGRGLLNDKFEWEASLDYTDPDANDGPKGKFGLNTSLRYHFGNNFSADFSASTADVGETYGLNFRFNFPR